MGQHNIKGDVINHHARISTQGSQQRVETESHGVASFRVLANASRSNRLSTIRVVSQSLQGTSQPLLAECDKGTREPLHRHPSIRSHIRRTESSFFTAAVVGRRHKRDANEPCDGMI